MQFGEEEIILARRLRDRGLPWEPKPGHFVYDETGFCRQPSPFQEKVYFILNYDYFMKAVGGVDRFKSIMIWLPTWYDARVILREFGISDEDISQHLQHEKAIEEGKERLVLYQLIESCLVSQTPSPPPLRKD